MGARIRVQGSRGVESAPWTHIDVRRIRYGERRQAHDKTIDTDGNDAITVLGINNRSFSFVGYIEDGLPNLVNKDVELTGTLEFDVGGDEPIKGSIVIRSFNFDIDYDEGGQPVIQGTGEFQDELTLPAR